MAKYIGVQGITGEQGIETGYHLIRYFNILTNNSTELFECNINIDNSENFIQNDIDICYNNNTFSLKNYNDISNDVIVEFYCHADISNTFNNNGTNNNTVLTFISISGELLNTTRNKLDIDTRSILKSNFDVLHLTYGPVIYTNKLINFNNYYSLQVQINFQNNIIFREIRLVIKLSTKS